MSNYISAVPVPIRGLCENELAVRRLIASLEFLGYMEFPIKRNKESALGRLSKVRARTLASVVAIGSQASLESRQAL